MKDWSNRCFQLVCVATLLLCPGIPGASEPADATQATMNAAMVAFYERGETARAVDLFREVLSQMPAHYGANFQLAKALEASGQPAEAQRQWARVLEAARAIGDGETTATAEARGPAAGRAARMQEGMRLYYQERQPEAAAVVYREVLAEMPSHYGANFQLARALTSTNQASEASAAWQTMLSMAQAIGDKDTVATAERNLAEIKMADLMRQGVDALYRRHEASAAADDFRAVLAMLPTHYGATYQLAVALDALEQPGEARKVWKKVQKMARAAKDPFTSDAAKEALAR